ncbi:MAG: regulator of protease activity HflC (stomatin/prohibitin superfamily) [Planctomycetota bacterium]|jgi:regulator of protease activity HflC (stomatin/prohibitin superfamily)
MDKAKIFLGVVGGVITLSLLSMALVERVPPGVIGVRQSLWGGGVASTDFEMGYHMGVTGMHRWHFLDRRTHFLTWTDGGRSTTQGQTLPPLEIRTKDGNTAAFDLTVTYRIKEGEGHLLVQKGNQQKYRQLVISGVEDILRQELAQMSSEDIYSTEERTRRAGEMLPGLRVALAKYHVNPQIVLIRAVSFPDGYESRLQDKQLTTQKQLLAESEKLLEDQRAKTETIEAEIKAAEQELVGDWEKRLQQASSDNQVAIAEIRAEAEIYAAQVNADADAAYETSIALGNLAVAKSEALRNELRNRALDTVGGRIFMAQQAAENLQFDSVTLNSNDPNVPTILDIGEMVDMLVGNRRAAPAGN